MALSNVSREARLRGSANQASLSHHIPDNTRSPDYHVDVEGSVVTQRLDQFAQQAGLGPSLLLKIDTEGHDLEVLQGARNLLEMGAVAAIVFELAGQMNEDFFRVHKEAAQVLQTSSLTALARAKSVRNLAKPTLQSMVHWLETFGYATWMHIGSQEAYMHIDCKHSCWNMLQESFLLGSRSLVPLSGLWWHDSFEVCWSYPQLACWYDVLALPREGRRRAHHKELPKSRVCTASLSSLPCRSGFWSSFPVKTVLLHAFASI